MNYKMIAYVLGSLLRIEGALMTIPMVLSFAYGEGPARNAFMLTILICLVLGTLIRYREPENKSIYGREGFVVVALSWTVMSLFGAMPFYLSGAIDGFVNCFFETVSGFTTTGASILREIEGLPMSILFWRSFTHWIGGMGILVFMLAILPMGDERSMYLMKAEAPGPMVSKLVPKVKSTAKLLYKIYIALTIIEMFLLLLGGMPLFDSVVNSLSTAGTGGFAILNSSIAGYNNAYYEYVITIFMLLFGVNFNLYYLLLLRDFKSILKNEELRYYVVIVIACIALITGNIYHMYPTLESAFRHAAFQVAAIVTTTGFATANFDVGQMIGATGLLSGFALAMYKRVDADKRKNYRSMFISTVLAVFLTGVTEPLEFMFMFCALPLYIIYALLQGCAFAMAGVIDLRLHSFGNLEFITRVPMSLKAGLGGDIINFIICCAAFLIIGYVVAYFMIGKFKYATPGRLGNYTDETSDEETGTTAKTTAGNSQPERIITLLGGRENITLVDACMTRLRVTVKDPSKVAGEAEWKAEGALGLVMKDTGIQAIYGPKADVLKSDINDIL